MFNSVFPVLRFIRKKSDALFIRINWSLYSPWNNAEHLQFDIRAFNVSCICHGGIIKIGERALPVQRYQHSYRRFFKRLALSSHSWVLVPMSTVLPVFLSIAFTVLCEGCEARFLHRIYWESNTGPSRGSPSHYCCAMPAPLKHVLNFREIFS